MKGKMWISSLVLVLICSPWVETLFLPLKQTIRTTQKKENLKLQSSYLDELNMLRTDKRVLVGFTTDAWSIGTKKMKDLLAVYHMYTRIQRSNIPCIETPMWEISQGPHYDEMQRLLETYWIPDFTSAENLLLQFDLIVIPDPVIAKYMVEAYHVKEDKVKKKKAYYEKLMRQSWGAIEAFPPREKYDFERVKDLSKQKWIRKFPPIATVGEPAYKRLRYDTPIEYFAYGVEDFALHLPLSLVPTKRVLVLRYRNRFDSLVQSLLMRGVNATSAYPVTCMRREWNTQEERLAKEVDVVYFHQAHAVQEWRSRLGDTGKEPVAVCQNLEVAQAAKASGFQDVFYARVADTQGLVDVVKKGVEFARSPDRLAVKRA